VRSEGQIQDSVLSEKLAQDEAPMEEQKSQAAASDYEGGSSDEMSVSTDEDDREDLKLAEEEDKRIMFEAIEKVQRQQEARL